MSNYDLNAQIMKAILPDSPEFISEDGYKITEKGREEADLNLLHSPDAVDTYLKLTFNHLKAYLSKNQQKILQDGFDVAMRQIKAKHNLMIELYEALDEKDKEIADLKEAQKYHEN